MPQQLLLNLIYFLHVCVRERESEQADKHVVSVEDRGIMFHSARVIGGLELPDMGAWSQASV